MKYKTGEEFLNKLYFNMHMSEEVMHNASKSDSPEQKISKYMDRLEKVHSIAKTNSHKMDILKKFYYDKYVIKEVPDNYIKLQQRIAYEQGYGNIIIDNRAKNRLLNNLQVDQKLSLDRWIEYLVSDNSPYPMWFKNYAFQGMLKLGYFDKEKQEYKKRTKKTTNPFIELNGEVLSYVYDALKNEIGEDQLTEEQQKALEQGESFKKLYTYYLTKVTKKENDKEIDGIWIKYDQGTDSKILCDTLQGKNTGWCTAGYETAKAQLDGGDFYIYYTKDKEGKYTNPRIAIRMEGHDVIGEVRGINEDQNLESSMIEIANKKLEEFPDKKNYDKKVYDMQKLTQIENKTNEEVDLSIDELKFLYEFDYEIEGFGYQKDPRILEIKKKRSIVNDINRITKKEKEFVGSLDLSFIEDAEGLILPEEIDGDLYLTNITSIDNLKLPRIVRGSLNLSHITKIGNSELPEEVGGDLNLACIDDANIKFPKVVRGGIYLPGLTRVNSLKLPEEVGGYIDLINLTKADELILPKIMRGSIDLSRLENVNSMELSKRMEGYIDLYSLKKAENLVFPDEIGPGLDLSSIESIKNTKFPKRINGCLKLCNLKEIKNTEFPKVIGMDLELTSLEKVKKKLELPEEIGGDLVLSSLISGENIKFPKRIEGSLFLDKLQSLNNTELPEVLEGRLSLHGLSDFEVNLPESYYNLCNEEGIDTFATINYIPDNVYFKKNKEDIEALVDNCKSR